MTSKSETKQCQKCGVAYPATKGPSKYCSVCREIIKKQQIRDYHKNQKKQMEPRPSVTIEDAIHMSMETGKTYGQLQKEGKI